MMPCFSSHSHVATNLHFRALSRRRRDQRTDCLRPCALRHSCLDWAAPLLPQRRKVRSLQSIRQSSSASAARKKTMQTCRVAPSDRRRAASLRQRLGTVRLELNSCDACARRYSRCLTFELTRGRKRATPAVALRVQRRVRRCHFSLSESDSTYSKPLKRSDSARLSVLRRLSARS
jgi:hypothetical protein